MGFLDAGYALFEYTGQKLLDFYDILSSAPAIVKIFQNPNTKKSRRKEKGLAGRFLTPKRGITKSSKSHKHSKRDAHILVTPRTPKLSLASTPSIKSTPSQPIPIPVSAPTPAPEKIQKLESELTKLREEIAKLMQTPKAGTQQTGGVSGTVSFPAQTPTPQSFVPPPPATPVIATSTAAAPPPPPPPPPPAALESTPKLVRSVSTIEQGATPSTPTKAMQKSMSLADVLKGASAANLRKTDLSRSPGGTPLDAPKSNSRLNDPQDFIAQALKKKFASINKFNTPETSQKRKQVDGDSGWDESPPPSPGRNRKYTPIAFVQDENVPPVENVRA